VRPVGTLPFHITEWVSIWLVAGLYTFFRGSMSNFAIDRI